MSSVLRILSLEDDLNDFELIRHMLSKERIACELVRVAKEEEFLAAVSSSSFDLILADHSLPGFDGLSALQIVRQEHADLPFIFVSGALGEELAIETLRSGATDYVLKTRLSRLGPAVRRALQEAENKAERKSAEEAYRTVVEKSLQGLLVFQNQRIAFTNPAMATIVGYSVEEVLALSPDEILRLVHPEDRERISQRVVETWPNVPVTTGYELRVFRKDGTVRWLSVFGGSIEYKGKPALQAAVIDITMRKQAEEALRESEERYRLLVENSTDLVAEVGGDGVFLYLSPNFRGILGYEPSELIGTNVLSKIHGRDLQQVKRDFFQDKPTGLYRYRHKDGSWHWLESASQRFKTSTGDERIVLVSRDVTQRQLADAELEQSREQLQRFSEHLENTLDEERKRISREIHDELGQLLTILKFDISWIKFNGAEGNQPLAEKADSMMETIGQALGSVKRISREVRPPQLDALGLAGAIQWEVQQLATKAGIHPTVTFSPQEFTLDKERGLVLYRIFHEALTNVARHSQATEMSVEVVKKSDVVLLKMHDNGRGISRKELRGTMSLGLVGMRERIRPWNGKLSIAGKQGKGTTVSVQIPLEETNFGGVRP